MPNSDDIARIDMFVSLPLTSTTSMQPLPSKDVLRHIVDVHCHPTDSEIPDEIIKSLPITICAMATRPSDQSKVAGLARSNPLQVVPCFGYHPWFAHWISVVDGQTTPPKEQHYRSLFRLQTSEEETDTESDTKLQAFAKLLPSLPDPISLADCLSAIRTNFEQFPEAMLGEIGLDRSARVPFDYREERREISPFSVPFEHQLALVEAQLDLAVEMGRNVSFHSVKSQKATVDLLARLKDKHGPKWNNISLDLHSCGLSPETWCDIEKAHVNVFLSLSTAINGRSPMHRKLIAAASPERLLAESDIHEIGQCTERTWDMLCTIAEVRGWHIEEEWEEDLKEDCWGAVRKLESNWIRFRRAAHIPKLGKAREKVAKEK